MTDELAIAFGAELRSAGKLGGQRDEVQAARLFAIQFSTYIEFISSGAEGVGISSTAGLAVLASGDSITVAGSTTANHGTTATQVNGGHGALSPGKDSGVDVDMNDVSETVESEEVVMTELEMVSHDTLGEWINTHRW